MLGGDGGKWVLFKLMGVLLAIGTQAQVKASYYYYCFFCLFLFFVNNTCCFVAASMSAEAVKIRYI